MISSEEKKSFEVFIGTDIGTFKRLNTESNSCRDIISPPQCEKDDNIICSNWTNDLKESILLGLKNGTVKEYDLLTDKIKTKSKIKFDNDVLVGLSRYKKFTLTVLQSGKIKIWRKKRPLELDAGSNLETMRHFNYSELLATGGIENPLKIFNLEQGACTFIGKNVPNDQLLQLRVPIRISDIAWLTQTNLATVSRLNTVCVYDTRVQRRPVLKNEFPKSVFSRAVPYTETSIIAGGGRGLLGYIDFRKGVKLVHSYKGPVGAVKDIVCDSDFLFSVGLDRRLRVHNIKNKKLILDKYLKIRLNNVLAKENVFKEEIKMEIKDESFEEAHIGDEDLLIEQDDIFDDKKRKNLFENDNVKRKLNKI